MINFKKSTHEGRIRKYYDINYNVIINEKISNYIYSDSEIEPLKKALQYYLHNIFIDSQTTISELNSWNWEKFNLLSILITIKNFLQEIIKGEINIEISSDYPRMLDKLVYYLDLFSVWYIEKILKIDFNLISNNFFVKNEEYLPEFE